MAPLAEVYWTDARLVKQVLAEDPRAFERLISRHQRRACAIARATGVRPDDLEDVVQESFVRAFEKLAQLRAPGSFRSWFVEIVRNVARNSLRRESRRPTSLTPAEGGEPRIDSFPAASSRITSPASVPARRLLSGGQRLPLLHFLVTIASRDNATDSFGGSS